MDVALSIITGLGLRFILSNAAYSGPANHLTTALLGLWEGGVVHQVAARSQSPLLDHSLAYILRLALDLLITKNFKRMFLVLLCTALGCLGSEAIAPYASLRLQIKKLRERERMKERRHRHSRSTNTTVPVLSAPLPPRVRAYQHPDDQAQVPIPSTSLQQTQMITPQFPAIPPATPPSFFLQENSELYSPPPKPILIQPFAASTPRDAFPARPPTALASVLECSPDSNTPLLVPNNLPTPPESGERSVPSDMNNEAQGSRRLSTIAELSGDDNSHRETEDEHQKDDHNHGDYVPSFVATNGALPVPNPESRYLANANGEKRLSSQSTKATNMFNGPFPEASSSTAPLPIPIPVRNFLWEMDTPTQAFAESDLKQAADGIFEVQIGNDYQADAEGGDSGNDSDELRTPGTRHLLVVETDNEHEGDPLLTPVAEHPQFQPNDDPGELLSPLAINVRSALHSDEEFPSNPIPAANPAGPFEFQFAPMNPSWDDPNQKASSSGDPHFPGSLYQNPPLQPPLHTTSGPFMDRAASPPDSPATVASDVTNISVLSTAVPSKLYTRGDELRKEAWEKEQELSRFEAEWRKAEHEKRVADALKLKVKVRELREQTYKLHEKAAKRYYAARNSLAVPTKIDVHGLRSREAFERVDAALLTVIEKGKTSLRVIVGRGNHSVNKQPVLKNTVQREMLRQGFKCEVDPRNPGILIITIPPQPQPQL